MKIVDSGVGILRYLLLVPILAYLSYHSLLDGSKEFLVSSIFIGFYLCLLFLIERKTEKKILADGRDRNFYKIEIEELNSKLEINMKIIEALHQEIQDLRSLAENESLKKSKAIQKFKDIQKLRYRGKVDASKEKK